MKRFTASEKWEKVWFQELDPRLKLLWLYMVDKSDGCGVWDVNLRLASFCIGEEVSESDLKVFGDRLERIKESKVWIKSFVSFQYGGHLNEKSPPHKAVIKLLLKHNLIDRVDVTLELPLARGSSTPKDKDKDKDKEKDKGKGKETNESIKRIIGHLNDASGSSYSEAKTTMSLVRARLGEDGVTEEGIIRMIDSKVIDWEDTKYAQYLRPATLFGPQNFPNYYGQRNTKRNGASEKMPVAVDGTGRKLRKFK